MMGVFYLTKLGGKMYLFKDIDNNEFDQYAITKKLKNIGAHDSDILFIHTDIAFGTPNISIKRKEYLEALYNSIKDLNVGTLIFPAFSYSFCNNEVFDVRKTKTSMGVLNEYVRKLPEAQRTIDPLLSLVLFGKQKHLLDGNLGQHSLGIDSAFDKLHHKANGMKFLFFGAEFEEYFTYVHYVEKILDVPYRFDKAFSGKIIDYNGNEYEDTHYIHTQCGKVKLKNYHQMKLELIDEKKLKSTKLGNLELVCLSEEDAYKAIYNRISNNINSFVEPFLQEDLTHEYTFGKNGERVTHC